METFSDVIDAFGGPANVGRVIGVTTEHASLMKQRGSIPPFYWSKLIEGAVQRGIQGINWEALATMAAQRRKHTSRFPAPARAALDKNSATASEPEAAE